MSNQVSRGASGSIFNHELRAPVPRSVFDKSFIHTFSADFGELIPFYLEDVLPNDDFKISNIIRVSTLPMVSPIYNAVKIKTWYFYVPYYLLWRHFDRFISGGRDGTYDVLSPIIGDKDNGITFQKNSIADYMNFPVGVNLPADDCPSAFPFMAYQRIYRDYFFNQDVQTDSNVNNWFPDDDSKFQLLDGFQSTIAPNGATAEDPAIDLTAKRYKNWEKDYFTSAMFNPQRGPSTALPITLSGQGPASGYPFHDIASQRLDVDLKLSNGSFTPYADNGYLGIRGGLNMANAEQSDFLSSGSSWPSSATDLFYLQSRGALNPFFMGRFTDISSGTERYGRFGVDSPDIPMPTKSEFDTYLGAYMSSSSGGFLIDDLRLATQLQLWLERNMRTKAQYTEFLKIHFNDSPIDLRLTKPYYIGGSSQILNITQVLQTSQTTDDSELGQRAGEGNSYGAFDIGRFHSHEYGLIMGIMCIMPDAMYTQGLSRVWSKRSRYDYYFPEFAQLSPQAILTKELYAGTDSSKNNAVFGYQGRFDEYRSAQNIVTGLLRDPTQLDFYTYTLARQFDNYPTLSPEFINSYGTVRHDAFVSGTTLPPFICQVGLGIRAVRPLPYVNEPMGLL